MNAAIENTEHLAEQVYGTFRLGTDEFGIGASTIREVINAPDCFSPNPLYPKHIIGTLTLRDTIIPVIDMVTLFQREQSENLHQQKIAIIDYHHQPIGLLFDQTGDVFHSKNSGCEYVKCAEVTSFGVTLGAFWFKKQERIVQLLDAHGIIEYHGAPPRIDKHKASSFLQNQVSHRGPRLQSITFRVGELEMAIDMTEVREVLAGSLIEDSDLANGVLLGTHNLRGQAVPLIDLKIAFDINSKRTEADISDSRIIVAIHKGEPFGLVVDEISGLVHYYADELLSYPSFSQKAPDLFLGCIRNESGDELIQLDLPMLFEMPEVETAVDNSQAFFEQSSAAERNEQVLQAGELVSYLCFVIDAQYAVPLSDIIEVVDYPDKLVQPPMLNAVFDGVLNLRGEFIATVGTRSLYQLDSAADEYRHIIVFERDGHRYGLAVSSVTSIIHVDSNQKQQFPSLLREKETRISEDTIETLLLDIDASEMSAAVSILSLSSIVARIIDLTPA